MKHISIIFKIICISLALSTAACSVKPFKFDIKQGNLLSYRQVNQVREGMNREQVQYVLGTPLLQDIFTPNEWHYVYYERQAHKAPVQRKLVVHFDNNRVNHIARDGRQAPTV